MMMTTYIILGILVIGAFSYLMMRGGGCCCAHNHGGHGGHHDAGGPQPGQTDHSSHQCGHGQEATMDDTAKDAMKDPVCGMQVEKNASTLTSEYNGRSFYFCSEHCMKQFDLEPGKYLK